MVKSHIEEQIQEVEIMDSIICNCCGKDITREQSEFLTVQSMFGYFTKVFSDGEKHVSEICEECYGNWIKTFKYPPKGFGLTRWDIVDFEEWKNRR